MKSIRRLSVILLVLAISLTPLHAMAVVVDSNGSEAEVTLKSIKSFDDIETVGIEDIRAVKFAVGQKEEIVPVVISKKGMIEIAASYISTETGYTSADISLFADKECTQKVDYTIYCKPNDAEIQTKEFYLTQAGTYYLKFNRYKDLVEDRVEFGIIHYDGSDRDLNNKEITISSSNYKNSEISYKVTASKAGTLRVDLDFIKENGYATVKILNSKKKAISDGVSTYNSGDRTCYFALDKGTYYIKVSTSSGTYAVQSTFTAVVDKSGASKSKATVLKKGGAGVKGIVTLGDKVSKEDWFRVTLPKKQKVNFELKGTCSGSVRMQIVPANGSVIIGGGRSLSKPGGTVSLKSDGAWAKGVYYIKVTKSNNTASGSYTIRVK